MSFQLTFVSGAWILYGIAALLLAAVVLKTRPSNVGNIALGAFLLQQAGATATALLLDAAGSRATITAAFNVGTFFWLLWTPVLFAIPAALLRGSERERPALIAGIVGALPGVGMLVAWVVAPELVFSPEGLGLTPLAMGVFLLAFLGFASAVAFLAWEAHATPMPLRRGRFAILAMAFAGEGTYHALQNSIQSLQEGSFHGMPLTDGTTLVLVLAPTVAFAAMTAAAAWVAWSDLDADRRRWARYLVSVLVVGSVTGAIAAPIVSADELHHPSGIFHALWDLAFVCLLFFSAMRYQLFTIERRAQVGVALAVGFFLAAGVFVAVEQLAEDFLQARFAGVLPRPGLVAALITTAAGVPLHHVSMKVARRFFPKVAKTVDYERQRSEEVYRAAVEGVMLDGHADPSEARSLARLRETLKIADAEARRIESSVVSLARAAAPA